MKLDWKKTGLSLAFALCGGTAGATVVTPGCTLEPGLACSLAELVSDPSLAYIEIDGVKFGNFSQDFFPPDDLRNIRVEAIDSAGDGSQPGSMVGLSFSAIGSLPSLLQAFSAATYSVDRFIFYDINVLSGLPIGASNLQVRFGNYAFTGGFSLDGGVLKDIENKASMSGLCSQWYNYNGDPSSNCEGRTSVDNEAFGPTSTMSVTDNLYIQHVGFIAGDDGMQILRFDQAYARVVPEPPGLALLGLGALLFFNRRRQSRRGAASGMA